MRQYVIGMLVGAALSTSFGASAAVEQIIGKAVEGTAAVKLNGQKLDKESVIVDGSSYAPVRAIGEALGLEVGFKDGEVTLQSKKEAPAVNETKKTVEEIDYEIESFKNAKMIKERTLSLSEAAKKAYPQTDVYDHEIEVYKGEITEFEKKIADLERRKAELSSK